MSDNSDSLLPITCEIQILGQKRKVFFGTRNVIAINHKFGTFAKVFYDGLFSGDLLNIVQAIWSSTLIFKKFDPKNPIDIEDELDVEELFKLSILELKAIGQQVTKIVYENCISEEMIEESKKKETPKKTPKTRTKKKKS